MNVVYEYCLFALACVCVVREFLLRLDTTTAWQIKVVNPLEEHRAWLKYLGKARRQELLGPLRLEQRGLELCVVGLGECRPVPSVEHGLALISTLKDQIAALFPSAD